MNDVISSKLLIHSTTGAVFGNQHDWNNGNQFILIYNRILAVAKSIFSYEALNFDQNNSPTLFSNKSNCYQQKPRGQNSTYFYEPTFITYRWASDSRINLYQNTSIIDSVCLIFRKVKFSFIVIALNQSHSNRHPKQLVCLPRLIQQRNSNRNWGHRRGDLSWWQLILNDIYDDLDLKQ